MKYKQAIVLNCGDCNCSRGDVNKESPFCALTNRVIEDSFIIPSWCPLEDAPSTVIKSLILTCRWCGGDLNNQLQCINKQCNHYGE
jgi:Ni,Fe-hydrogenase III small subunit